MTRPKNSRVNYFVRCWCVLCVPHSYSSYLFLYLCLWWWCCVSFFLVTWGWLWVSSLIHMVILYFREILNEVLVIFWTPIYLPERYFGVQRMLLPCGPPPEREDDWEYSRKEKDVNGSDLLFARTNPMWCWQYVLDFTSHVED